MEEDSAVAASFSFSSLLPSISSFTSLTDPRNSLMPFPERPPDLRDATRAEENEQYHEDNRQFRPT